MTRREWMRRTAAAAAGGGGGGDGPFLDDYSRLGDTDTAITNTADLTYGAGSGSLTGASGFPGTVLADDWGGVESPYNSGGLGNADRSLGWYPSGFGKSLVFALSFTMPPGMTTLRLQFDFFVKWARFTNTKLRWDSLRLTNPLDPGFDHFFWIDNSLFDGASFNDVTWYNADDHAAGVSKREVDISGISIGGGAQSIQFNCSGGAGGTHPTIGTSDRKNIHAAIDNLILTPSI